MIHHKVEQNTAAWHYLRLGRPTASEFSRIVTAGGKASTQAEDYAHRLIAERMLGKPIAEDVQTAWMQRGQELEDSAIEAYEFQTGNETGLGGFCTTDDGLFGCSPDRMVGEDGLIEMKCPAPNTMVRYLDDPQCLGKEKRSQVQGELLVTGRKWVDLVSFHPEMPTVIVRVDRDEKYLDLLSAGLTAFCAQLDAMQRHLESLYGAFKPIVIPSDAPAAPEGDFDVTDQDIDGMIRAGIVRL